MRFKYEMGNWENKRIQDKVWTNHIHTTFMKNPKLQVIEKITELSTQVGKRWNMYST